jgi:small-conductance mechanosensitive channel
LETLDLFLTSPTGQSLVALGKSGVTIVIAWSLIRLVRRSLDSVAAKGFIHDQLGATIHNISKWIIIFVTFLVILGFFGVSVASLWTALSTMMVLIAIGFVAVWSVLSNVLCSIFLVILAPFRIGDEIEIQDTSSVIVIRGRVVGINVMYTTLRAISEDPELVSGDELIRVPNNLFFQKYIRCWPGKKTKTLQSYLATQHQVAQGDAKNED